MRESSPAGAARLLCTKTRYVNVAAISHILFHRCRQISANARPRNRHGDESPDGDWALPWPRRASAPPGVASATPPTLRVSSPRRSRMRPSPHTNFHEWNHKARCFLESAAHLVCRVGGIRVAGIRRGPKVWKAQRRMAKVVAISLLHLCKCIGNPTFKTMRLCAF